MFTNSNKLIHALAHCTSLKLKKVLILKGATISLDDRKSNKCHLGMSGNTKTCFQVHIIFTPIYNIKRLHKLRKTAILIEILNKMDHINIY